MDKEFLIYQNVILKYYLIDQYLYLLKDNDNSWESYINLDSNRYVDILNEDNVIKRIYFDSIKVLTNHELRLRIKYGVIFENNEVFNKIIFSNILINRYFINLVKETDHVPYYILDKKFVYTNKELQIKIYINSFKYIDNNCINDLVFEIIFVILKFLWFLSIIYIACEVKQKKSKSGCQIIDSHKYNVFLTIPRYKFHCGRL